MQSERESAGNVVLTGMAGVGKSTIGILLARALGKDFVDVDVLIQTGEGGRLQEILDAQGGEGFLRVEERYVLNLKPHNAVISTGGSVVHSPKAMEHLKSLGTVVLLEAPAGVLKFRVRNADPRGLVMMGEKDFDGLYRLRQPLYRKWADIIVQCGGLAHDAVVDEVVRALSTSRG